MLAKAGQIVDAPGGVVTAGRQAGIEPVELLPLNTLCNGRWPKPGDGQDGACKGENADRHTASP